MAENTRTLEKLMKKRRYFELNRLKVEPRFAEKAMYTMCEPPFQVTGKN